MPLALDPDEAERLYQRALAIREIRTGGLWLPIMWHLALRGHTDAMIELANWCSYGNSLQALGRASDRFSPAGLYRRAYRQGDARAAQHMAMSCFNRNDLIGYRFWLAQGVRAGDGEAAEHRRWFETRFWHGAARDIWRGRPKQKRDGFK